MLVGIGMLCFMYAPLLTFLKNPPTKEEKKVSPLDNGLDNLGLQDEHHFKAVEKKHELISQENIVTKL